MLRRVEILSEWAKKYVLFMQKYIIEITCLGKLYVLLEHCNPVYTDDCYDNNVIRLCMSVNRQHLLLISEKILKICLLVHSVVSSMYKSTV